METTRSRWLRPGVALLVGWLALGASSLAQERTAQQRLDGLLETLGTPAVTQLLVPLGPAPSLDALLRPLEADFVPLQRRETSEETAARLEALITERDRLVSEDLETAHAVAEELVALAGEELGPDHPKTLDAARQVRILAALAPLPESQRVELLTGREGLRTLAALYREKRFEDALGLLVEQLELELEILGDGGSFAGPLGNTVALLHALGDYARAERVARCGLRRTCVEYGPGHPFVARTLNDLALLATAYRRLDDAEALHARSLDLRRRLYGDRGPEYALALMHLLELYRLRDDLDCAAEVGDRAIAILTELDTMPDRLGILLTQRGVLEWSAGQDELARASLEEAIRVLEHAHRDDHPELANARGALADVERGLGHFRRSLELAEDSLAMLDRLHDGAHPLKAQAQLRLALSLEVLGELDRAERAYRDAVLAMERDGNSDLASALDGLASLLARKGDVRGAEAMSERAIEEQRRAFGPSRLLANALCRLARRESAAGDLSGATQALGEALELYVERLGPEHPRIARVRVELAELCAAGGELDAARVQIDGVLEAAEAGAGVDRRGHANALRLAGRLALTGGELALAGEHARRCLTIRSALLEAPHPLLVEALVLTGEIDEAAGELEAAARAYNEALAQAESLRTRILGDERDRARYAGELTLGSLARSLTRVRLALGQPRAALEAAELGRERALLDLLERSGTDLVAVARAHDETLGDELAARLELENEARGGLLLAEQRLRRAASDPGVTDETLVALETATRDARRAWHARESELEAGLRAVWPSAQPLGATAVADALRDDEALLHYTFDERGVGLVVVRGGDNGGSLGLVLAHDGDSSHTLRGEVVEAIESLRSGGQLDDARRVALSRALLPPAAWELLAGASRLVVAPDGPLHEFPFENLVTPRGEWLENGPRLVYSSSAALFARNRVAPGRGASSHRRAVVLGAPIFGDETGVVRAANPTRSNLDRVRLFGERLRPLPGSEVEARQVAGELSAAGWAVESLLGTDARAPRLRERVLGATLVHLATHGLSASTARPYDAALALTAPEVWSETDDGFLTLDDLVRRWGGALDGCDLVVLSACDTQVGAALGESRVALSWGFFFAGADSVLVSLWKVDDRATALLMDRFYQNYTGRFDNERLVGGERFAAGRAMPEDAALQEAKAWLAHSTPSSNRARLAELGSGGENSGPRGDFPLPGAAPSSSLTDAAFDFRAPRFASAFVLYGQPD